MPREESLHPDEFLSLAARRGQVSAPEPSMVKVRLPRAQAGTPALQVQVSPASERAGAAPVVIVQVVQPPASPDGLCPRTVTHLVPPWHRLERPAGHGIAGNVAVGLGLFGLTTSLLCRDLLACEEDTNIALSGAALGTLAGVAGTGALEVLGWRPLERPLVHLHRGLRQLWASLCRPSVAEQLKAIVQDARQAPLTSDGLDAVLARCEQAMAGCSPQARRAAALHEIVLNLIPAATGSYSGPLADLVRSRVQTLAPGSVPGPAPGPAPGPVPARR